MAKAELPDDSDDARAGATTPGGGLKSRASPNGGVLFKFDVSSEKYEVAAPNVTPELTDDGDDEAPRWILEVGERSSALISPIFGAFEPRARASSLAGRTLQILRPPSQILTSWHPFLPPVHRLATCRARYPTSAASSPTTRPAGSTSSPPAPESTPCASTPTRASPRSPKPTATRSLKTRMGMRASDDNKEKVYGVGMSAWAQGEDHPDAVWDPTDERPPGDAADADADAMEEDDYEDESKGHHTASGEDVLDMKMGALDNSFLVRGNAVDVFRNQAGGALRDANVRVSLKDADGAFITPTKGILADAEQSMLLLSPETGRRDKIYQMDLERECVVSAWGCNKDGVDVPMTDIVTDSKSSQMEAGRGTFLGLDDNRLVRWDMRMEGGIAQTLASPTLGYADGHDFARGTKFRCMATTGDGCIAVGSEDGKIRLYSDKSMRQAKTSFPGLGAPITAIDVTHDGKWILATTDTCLVLLHTCVRDAKSGDLTTGFKTRAGERIPAPRLLKLKPEDAAKAKGAPLVKGKFTWVTEQGKQERWIVASCGTYSILFNFRRVKAATAPERRLLEYTDYNVVAKDAQIAESTFVHEKFTGNDTHLVIATTKGDVFCAGG